MNREWFQRLSDERPMALGNWSALARQIRERFVTVDKNTGQALREFHAQHFVARADLLAGLAEQVAARSSPALPIKAVAGAGKSALIAHFMPTMRALSQPGSCSKPLHTSAQGCPTSAHSTRIALALELGLDLRSN